MEGRSEDKLHVIHVGHSKGIDQLLHDRAKEGVLSLCVGYLPVSVGRTVLHDYSVASEAFLEAALKGAIRVHCQEHW